MTATAVITRRCSGSPYAANACLITTLFAVGLSKAGAPYRTLTRRAFRNLSDGPSVCISSGNLHSKSEASFIEAVHPLRNSSTPALASTFPVVPAGLDRSGLQRVKMKDL